MIECLKTKRRNKHVVLKSIRVSESKTKKNKKVGNKGNNTIFLPRSNDAKLFRRRSSCPVVVHVRRSRRDSPGRATSPAKWVTLRRRSYCHCYCRGCCFRRPSVLARAIKTSRASVRRVHQRFPNFYRLRRPRKIVFVSPQNRTGTPFPNQSARLFNRRPRGVFSNFFCGGGRGFLKYFFYSD